MYICSKKNKTSENPTYTLSVTFFAYLLYNSAQDRNKQNKTL